MDVNDKSETTESFCEEEAPDEIPQSLLIYFETSRSRAVICERLILEDNDDCEEPYSVMNLSSSDNDLDSLDQPQINSVLSSGSNNTNSLLCHSPCTEEANGPEVEIEKTLEEDSTEGSLSQSEELWTERERRVCEEEKMEERRRRRRESEFELELRRLEEAERMQQAELELMAKRAQAKLEQEMLLQQEMMKDLKQRVAEESRRRREEQAEFKREQEGRREEERRKAEALRQRRRDTAAQIQAEETNAPLDLLKVDEVITDGLGGHGQGEEGERAAVSHANNTHQDKALTTKGKVTLKTCVLESTYDDGTRSIKETKWAEVRDLREEVIGKNTQRPKGNVKEKDEQSGEDTNDREVVANVSKEEELQKIQSKVGEVGIQSEMQEKGSILGKEEEVEEGANCDEDSNLHKEDGIETHAAERESLVVQHNEKATIESKDTPKEIVKKKILISCNFLRNSLKFRRKAASNYGRDGRIDVETGEKGCDDEMMLSSNASTDGSKVSQEKGPNSSADVTNNSSGSRGSRADETREDDNQAAILETGNEGETGLKHRDLDTFKDDQGNSTSNDNNDKCGEEDKLPMKKDKHRVSNIEDKRGNADSTCGRSWSKERQGTSQAHNSTSPNRELKYDNLNEKDTPKTSSNRKTSQNESNSTQKCGSNEKAAMFFYANDRQTGNCEGKVYNLGRWEPNPNDAGKNAILETSNKEECSVSIAQDGNKPDMDHFEQEEAKNEAKITSKYQSKTVMIKPGGRGTDQATDNSSLEKLSMKSEEMPLNEAKVSRNLHEDEIFLNETFTVSSVSRDFEDEENRSEGLKEVGLSDESPRFMIDKGTSELDKESSKEAATLRAGKEEDALNVRAMTSEIHEERHDVGLEGGSCWSGLCLPEQTEQKRLRWMSECEPWSKLCVQKNLRNEQGAVLRRRGPKRAAAAGGDDLPPLAPRTLLHNTGMTALTQLTTVILQDLPDCSLSTLSQCLCLQSLSLRRCGLRALEHVNKLHQLCSIDAQENEIAFVDCENMSSLRVLRLGHNRLSSIHGLDGADRLTELDLSHNLITRIAGVESLRRLQSLSLSHNQLISSRGVASLSSLLHLDLSQNQLDSVQGLDHCALLCTLRLSGNGLTQPPDLKNHVLLRELHLDDNSISSLHSLTQYWLPMMQHLTVAQNSLTELPSLCDFVSLEDLDLRLNCLSELNGVCESLRKCPFIRDICLEGNPLQREPGWRSVLQKAAPGLRRIDGQLTDSPSAGPCFSPAAGSFLSLCRNQIQQTAELRQRHSSQISAASSPLDVLRSSCRRPEEVFRLAEEHRFQHEFGDTSTTSESEREGSTLEDSSRDAQQTNEEAALIQQTPRPSTGTEERGERERAATVIQACWRGVSLRRRLRDALARARRPDPGWDGWLEEPDVDGFVLDEALLDTDWSPTRPDDFTERHFHVLERPPSLKPSEFFTEESLTVLPPVTDFRPKQAWTTDEQDLDTTEETSPSDFVGVSSWTPYNGQDQSLSCQRNISPPSSAEVSGLPECTEKIMEEWGFRDANTALLMLKRARKMKSKREQQQKLKDPSVRLALFKRSASQTRPTEPRRPRAVVPGGETGETATGHRDQPRDETHLNTSSESFLPRMSRAILSGGRVQLVTDPGRARVASRSCPAISSAPGNNSERRYETELPCPKRGASTPLKKERISFRDNKLQLSGGWGSGKKRSKVCK